MHNKDTLSIFTVLQLTAALQTVITSARDNVTLHCNLTAYSQWTGPSPNGVIVYNNEGIPKFVNPLLGSKAARLSWGSNKSDLIISDVVKKEDEGNYTCYGNRASLSLRVFVRGICRL